MKNLKVGDKVIYIGKHGNLFTEGREYEVLRTVEECKEGGVLCSKGDVIIGIEDDTFYDEDEYWEDELDIIHYISEGYFNEYFKIKGEI